MAGWLVSIHYAGPKKQIPRPPGSGTSSWGMYGLWIGGGGGAGQVLIPGPEELVSEDMQKEGTALCRSAVALSVPPTHRLSCEITQSIARLQTWPGFK